MANPIEAGSSLIPGHRGDLSLFRFFSFRAIQYVRGLIPRGRAHSAKMRVEDFLCCDLRQGPGSISFVLSFSAVYIPLRGEQTINET
jgi:hypothetical protein